MDRPGHEHDLEEAFERGRQVGRVEGLAFGGVKRVFPWTLGAQFRFTQGWFQSYVNYERDVLEELRRVQRARWDERKSMGDCESQLAAARRSAEHAAAEADGLPWMQRRWLLWSQPWLDDVAHAEEMATDSRGRVDYLATLEQDIAHELSKVRAAVDTELQEGRGRACVVNAMRSAPNRPSGVREYRDIDEFVREDPAGRSLVEWLLPATKDLGGMDYGYDWRLEDPVQRWNTTRWRVAWFDDSSHELYALERLNPRPDVIPLSGPSPGDASGSGRVWLLGVLDDQAEVSSVIGELESHAQWERNSLVVVAEAVNAASGSNR
jgi:hypothetical protein